MPYQITILPQEKLLVAEQGDNLLDFLRKNGIAPYAPCGSNGICGKCRVKVSGENVLSCQYIVTSDISVEIPQKAKTEILTAGMKIDLDVNPAKEG